MTDNVRSSISNWGSTFPIHDPRIESQTEIEFPRSDSESSPKLKTIFGWLTRRTTKVRRNELEIIFMFSIFVEVKHFQNTLIIGLFFDHFNHYFGTLSLLIILFIIIVWYFQMITFIISFCFFFFFVCYPTLRIKIETVADGYSLWSNSSSHSCFGNTIFKFFYLFQFTILLQITEISISAKLVLCVRLFCACFEGLCRYYFSSSAFSPL